MCRPIVLIFLTLVIVSLCKKPHEHCGELETDIAKRYLFKGCTPVSVDCFMEKDVFWFKGTFLECADKFDSFAEDEKFNCIFKEGTLSVELECIVAINYTPRTTWIFWLTFVFVACLLVAMIIFLVKKVQLYVARNPELQDPNNRVCYCLSVEDVNNIARNWGRSRASRG